MGSLFVEPGQADVEGGASLELSFHRLQLELSGGEADLESFDLAQAAILLGLRDPVEQVGDDVAEPGGLGRVEA